MHARPSVGHSSMLIVDEAQRLWYDEEALLWLKPTERPLPDRHRIGTWDLIRRTSTSRSCARTLKQGLRPENVLRERAQQLLLDHVAMSPLQRTSALVNVQ